MASKSPSEGTLGEAIKEQMLILQLNAKRLRLEAGKLSTRVSEFREEQELANQLSQPKQPPPKSARAKQKNPNVYLSAPLFVWLMFSYLPDFLSVLPVDIC